MGKAGKHDAGKTCHPPHFAAQREASTLSENLIARFEAKLDAMRSELTMQRWLLGIGMAALVAAAIAQLFRG